MFQTVLGWGGRDATDLESCIKSILPRVKQQDVPEPELSVLLFQMFPN